MRHLQSIFKRKRLNQYGIAHHLLLLALVVVVIGGIGTYVIASSHAATAGYFKGHCKDEAHLQVVNAPGNASLTQAANVTIQVQQATDAQKCINDTTYRGPIYTFFVNGKEELHMLPGGATFIQSQLAEFGSTNTNAEVRHTDNQAFVVYRDFTSDAAAKVANQLLGLLSGTHTPPPGGGSAFFDGYCLDASHLKAVASTAKTALVQAADVTIKKQAATDSLKCVNNESYRGAIYTFVINGKEGIDMLPDAATAVKTQFASLSAKAGNVEVQHTKSGNFVTYRDFSSDAAQKVAYQLALYGL